jgi:hypothetical protein
VVIIYTIDGIDGSIIYMIDTVEFDFDTVEFDTGSTRSSSTPTTSPRARNDRLSGPLPNLVLSAKLDTF